jgi:hypothetical protein
MNSLEARKVNLSPVEFARLAIVRALARVGKDPLTWRPRLRKLQAKVGRCSIGRPTCRRERVTSCRAELPRSTQSRKRSVQSDLLPAPRSLLT